MSPAFSLESDFEGGIDWWLQREGRITENFGDTRIDKPMRWWANGNGVVLSYAPDKSQAAALANILSPGLHLPHADDVAEMEVCTAESCLDERVTTDVLTLLDRYRDKVRRTMVFKNLMKGAREETGIGVLDRRYGGPQERLYLKAVSRSEKAGINRLLLREER